MNNQPASFWMWTAMKTVKRIVLAIAGGPVLAVGIALMALIVLALLVFPGGVEVLAIERERAKHWMRPTCAFLLGKNLLLTRHSH
jgi:hypothetical protein